MAVFNWSAQANGAVVNGFVVATDVFTFDIATIKAAAIVISRDGGVSFSYQGKTVTISNIFPEQLTTTNVKFADQSQLIIGDNNVGTAGDSLGNNIVGTAQDDQIHGLDGFDTVDAGGGADLIYGNTGNDRLLGSSGNDTILAGQGADLVYGNLDDDTLMGGSGNDTIFGGQGNDTILAGSVRGDLNAGADLIYGGTGADSINGAAGNDTIYGGSGNDLIFTFSRGNDLVYGNQDDDQIHLQGSSDTGYGGQGNDFIGASEKKDGEVALIYGNLGNDTIFGGAGKDTVFGGQGDDDIIGLGNGDNLTGGLGADTFELLTLPRPPFPVGDSSGLTSDRADKIFDFVTGQDKMKIMGAGTAANYNEVSLSFVDTVEEAVTAYNNNATGAKQYSFLAGETDGYLVTDVDGNKQADSVIVLKNVNQLSGFDFTDIIA